MSVSILFLLHSKYILLISISVSAKYFKKYRYWIGSVIYHIGGSLHLIKIFTITSQLYFTSLHGKNTIQNFHIGYIWYGVVSLVSGIV